MLTTKYISRSPTLKSILGITLIITKALIKSLSSIKLYLSAQFNVCMTFLPNPKGQGVHNIKHFNYIMCALTFFRKKNVLSFKMSPYRSQGCKGQNICMHGVICFTLINLIMQHDYFQKIKECNLLTPPLGSRVSVRANYLLLLYLT